MWALILADLLFVGIHIVNVCMVRYDSLFLLDVDGGIPELFQYVKETCITVLLFYTLYRSRKVGYGFWAVLFLYCLCDDALMLHENIGEYLATTLAFKPMLNLRAQDLGELLVSGTAGAVLILPLLYYYFQSSSSYRAHSKILFILLLGLIFTGVFVDMLHIALDWGEEVNLLLTLTEDGGEMIIMSLILAYVCFMTAHSRQTSSP